MPEPPLPSVSDVTLLRAIGWPYTGEPTDAAWREALAAHPQATPARVIEQHRSGYVVADAPGVGVKAESLPEWQRPRFPAHERPAVGDWVLLEDATGKRPRIVALLPRHTGIKRGAAGEHYHQQVIAANIDTVFIVCGLDADFNPRRIERYLLLVGGGGAQTAAPEPVIVLTKADRTEYADDAVEVLADLTAQGVPVFTVNAKDPDSVAQLEPWLEPGHTVVLVGSSGAGKSTITNTLLGDERMKTGEVRESDSRGRHTTTYRALIPLPAGACLIDTPGMRELKPTGEEDLADGGFADIEALAAQCKFRDCSHDREPGCAVRAAIDSEALDEGRFLNYLKLRDEVAAAADKLASRLADKSNARVQGKALNKRLTDKYGKR
ncbi:ribosome small subunit-dependent GTPase A [Pseudoxanthomonas sp. LH2527]|uniref:ribosome small subunit-dependent GTPase A n=1 Tax=Pseudoxanthomonas sp. LH2527 TaxID=2923249 RepID=UPI001F13D38A|nr:ribosome small subunit-dependent GTPase A [Pseudoxanthomonas sp. LH2527]MCH6482818.1 ribosome small subunit-dependent GTPase A [Pseudoxanthomonas sp. LH2527]